MCVKVKACSERVFWRFRSIRDNTRLRVGSTSFTKLAKRAFSTYLYLNINRGQTSNLKLLPDFVPFCTGLFILKLKYSVRYLERTFTKDNVLSTDRSVHDHLKYQIRFSKRGDSINFCSIRHQTIHINVKIFNKILREVFPKE